MGGYRIHNSIDKTNSRDLVYISAIIDGSTGFSGEVQDGAALERGLRSLVKVFRTVVCEIGDARR